MRQNIVIPDGKIANRSIIVTILCDFGIWAFCKGQKCLYTRVKVKNAHVCTNAKKPISETKNSVHVKNSHVLRVCRAKVLIRWIENEAWESESVYAITFGADD